MGNVLWAQRKDYIYLTIDLKEPQNVVIDLTEDAISFSAKCEGNSYQFKLDFYDKIDKKESKESRLRLIELCLKKSTAESWKKLHKGGKLSFVKIDWNKYVDSDAEDEKPGFDMSGMGDMDFGGMGDMDSDDDELPDLQSGVESSEAPKPPTEDPT